MPHDMAQHQPALPDPETMRQALEFTWHDANGLPWEVRQTRDPSGPALQRYVGGIFHQDNRVGATRRLVSIKNRVGLYIEHITMNLDPVARGFGFANAYWKASLVEYRRLGIKQVVLNANGDGTSFWARPEVSFQRPGLPRDMLAGWALKNEGVGQTGFVQAAARRSIRNDDVTQFVALVCNTPHLLTPAGLHGTALGKLLLEGSSWSGFATP